MQQQQQQISGVHYPLKICTCTHITKTETAVIAFASLCELVKPLLKWQYSHMWVKVNVLWIWPISATPVCYRMTKMQMLFFSHMLISICYYNFPRCAESESETTKQETQYSTLLTTNPWQASASIVWQTMCYVSAAWSLKRISTVLHWSVDCHPVNSTCTVQCVCVLVRVPVSWPVVKHSPLFSILCGDKRLILAVIP